MITMLTNERHNLPNQVSFYYIKHIKVERYPLGQVCENIMLLFNKSKKIPQELSSELKGRIRKTHANKTRT